MRFHQAHNSSDYKDRQEGTKWKVGRQLSIKHWIMSRCEENYTSFFHKRKQLHLLEIINQNEMNSKTINMYSDGLIKQCEIQLGQQKYTEKNIKQNKRK